MNIVENPYTYLGGTSDEIKVSTNHNNLQVSFGGSLTSTGLTIDVFYVGCTEAESFVLDSGKKSFKILDAFVEKYVISGGAAGSYTITNKQWLNAVVPFNR